MNIALTLSGGTGTRMGGEIPKQYQLLLGKPVIIHTLEQFQYCEKIDYIVVVADSVWREQILQWKEEFCLTKLQSIAPAGMDRQMSVRNGLAAAKPFMAEQPGGVIVQDAVRPLTSLALLNRLLEGLRDAPCVMPALAVTDTAYISEDGQWVDGLLDRSLLYGGQAPEAFHYQPYLQLYEETPPEELCSMSGSCQLPYSKGWKVKIVPGERDNIKITYPLDFKMCEILLREKGGIS